MDEVVLTKPRHDTGRVSPASGAVLLLALLALLFAAAPAHAQATGSILGRVLDARSGEPVVGAELQVVGLTPHGTSVEGGRFVVAAVPPGERTLRVERLGYRTQEVTGLVVRGGRPTELTVRLQPQAVEVGGVEVTATRQTPLVDPEAVSSRDVVTGRELRELPVDATAQAIDLATGVSEGHFRGGRIGQELYVVDGVEVKNRLEASSQGEGLEFSPSSLEELEVVTGGFGAEYGSALSGVVNLVTRRGSTERWNGRAAVSTDEWAPTSLLRGFSSLSLSAGGPLRFLGQRTTLFADLLTQGMEDADPRARGLTCLDASDAAPDLADAIQQLRSGAGAALYCPYSGSALPNDAGDKLIGFVRFDRPLAGGLNLTASLLHNRTQQELYEPDFKYNPEYQLGERTQGSLGMLILDWAGQHGGVARHLTLRGSAMQLDRYLGALDVAALDSRGTVAGFGLSRFDFLGEDYVRDTPIAEQIAHPQPVPGYVAPAGGALSPFGPAGEGIFFTTGTPGLANWTRSRSAGADAVFELTTARGGRFKAGGSGKLYQVESYQRTQAYRAGSLPDYARFYPATVSAFVEGGLDTPNEFNFDVGVRVEAFRSGLSFRPDRGDFLSPVVDTDWQVSFMPRIGASFPVTPHTVVRANYGIVAQPPDFQYFLDSAIGDSLRTDIRRQGNPALGFEHGNAFEMGLTHVLASERMALGVVVFRKQLLNLVTSGIGLAGPAEFNTRDHGQVTGAELSVEGRWPMAVLHAGYALQKATGVSGGALGDTLGGGVGPTVEYPLPFDRRHAIDLSLFAGSAAAAAAPWGVVLTTTAQSGYPLFRGFEGDSLRFVTTRLPWTAELDLRATYTIGRLPGCGGCRLRVLADGRNLLGLRNVRALRRESGSVAPLLSDVRALAASRTLSAPIPMESPIYSANADLNRDGLITPDEYSTARFAAALDRDDPSLYFGPARQLRLGAEVSF